MSKSKKRRSGAARSTSRPVAAPPARRRPWAMWAGLAGGIVLAALALTAFLAWQDSRNANSPTTGGAPNLEVDQTRIDFGDVPMSKLVKASFKLSNTGDGPLKISAPPVPEVLEGC